jgi:hypothetical protein
MSHDRAFKVQTIQGARGWCRQDFGPADVALSKLFNAAEEIKQQYDSGKFSGTVAAVSPAEPAQLPGDDDETADDRASAADDKILAKMCFDLVSARAERARVEAVGEKPREMYRVGLPLIFWLALDAKSRHWVKRRCGKYNSHKLMFKVIGFVLWNLMLDLQRAGFEPDLEMLKIAVEESGLLERADVYFLENYQDRWDALWVATPGDGKHKQVVKVC